MSIFGGLWLVIGRGLASIAAKFGWERFKSWRAATKAAAGGDAARAAGLPGLVRRELIALAASNTLPVDLKNDDVRAWLQRIGHDGLFASVLLARVGNSTASSVAAENQLALAFSEATGEVQQRAEGAIRYVVSHIVETLQATQAGQQSLQRALGLDSAAQLQALLDTVPQLQPLNRLTDRAHPMAIEFCLAGKRSWKVPDTILPLGMQRIGTDRQLDREVVELDQLRAAVAQGGRVLLIGDGGVGKTTQLLHLCELILATDGRIALYLDAASWARTGKGLLEYLCERSQAVKYGVTPQMLTRLAEAGQVALCINGWNEIAASARLQCHNELIDLEATVPRLAWVVATRSSADLAAGSNTMEVEVLGLRWREQVAAIRANLSSARASEIVDLLAARNELRIAARSPLILQGLLAVGQREGIENASGLDFIDAAISQFEGNVQHAELLRAPPLEGHHRAYLEELAWRLNSAIQTVFERDEALRALTSTARDLQSRGSVAATPISSDLLDALIAHHLLQTEEGGIRFSHQRFQEFFAAQRILADCMQPDGEHPWLGVALRSAGWEQTLSLVAQRLRREPERRRTMVWSAMAVDVGWACDLIGACGLPEDADSGISLACIESLDRLAASPLREVSELATCLRISTCWPRFADDLWPLLESDNDHTRLETYRSGGKGVSLTQLGQGAEDRISGWPVDRQVEIVHEIASHPDNFSYLVQLARGSSELPVRSAAIAALLWEYPASDAGLQAWASAPKDLKVELMADVASLVDRSQEPDYVTATLRELVETASDGIKVKFVQIFPDRTVGGLESALTSYLRGVDDIQADPRLVELALQRARPQATLLAIELARGHSPLPDWAFRVLDAQEGVSRDEVRQALLSRMMGEDWKTADTFALGWYASPVTTTELLPVWLACELDARGAADEQARLRARSMHEALMATPGAMLVAAAQSIFSTATDQQVEILLELLLRRSELRATDQRRSAAAWLPTAAEIRQVVHSVSAFAFGRNNRESAMAYLCCLAVKADWNEFRPLVVEACKRHLVLWAEYRAKIAHWRPGEVRPSNPSMGLYLLSAVAGCGFGISEDLLALTNQPAADDFIPEALARVAAEPWMARMEHKGLPEPSFAIAIAEGRRRQSLGMAFCQPEPDLQDATDAIGAYLATGIRGVLAASTGPSKRHDLQTGNYRLEQWCRHAAAVPTRMTLPAFVEALSSCELGGSGMVGVLKAMVRAGEWSMTPALVSHIEGLIEFLQVHRHAQQDFWIAGSLASALVCMVPDDLLSKPWSHYLQIWGNAANWHSVIDACKSDGCNRRWEILQSLLNQAGDSRDSAAVAILSITTDATLHHFLDALRSGKLTQSWMSHWKFGNSIKKIAAMMRDKPSRIDAFRDACRQAGNAFADAFAIQVLVHVDRNSPGAAEYFLEALDAGLVSSMYAPSIHALESLFYLRIEVDDNTFETSPSACEYLRAALYERAVAGTGAADISRRLLAKIETERRENGRPDTEPRHPKPSVHDEWIRAALAA